jgi:hypothetical protein
VVTTGKFPVPALRNVEVCDAIAGSSVQNADLAGQLGCDSEIGKASVFQVAGSDRYSTLAVSKDHLCWVESTRCLLDSGTRASASSQFLRRLGSMCGVGNWGMSSRGGE